jgi:hypothetical protein
VISTSPGGQAPDSRAGAALRFLCELIAWVAAPWALWPHSPALAIASVVLLIGLPTVFGAPGDKARTVVPVPGVVVIALDLLQFTAAVVASWVAWTAAIAVAVTILAVAAAVSQLPRWRWLAGAPSGRAQA